MFASKCVALTGVLLLVGILGIGVAPAWAQADGIVRGRVVAAADGSSLAPAHVSLEPASGEPLQTMTDEAGSFVFRRVRPGEYVLSATADGFGTRRTRVLIEPREVRIVTIPLEVAAVAVSVTVSAELPMASTHSPSSTLVAADRLETLPVQQRTSLPDVLVTLAPGMIRGHDDFVHIRGHEVALNPSINGVQFWENAHAVFSPGLGVDYIESVNVMTGGFPAEYGNRFGGILDVVTKSGFTMRDCGSIVLGVGSAQRHNVGFEWGGRSDRAAYYVNLSGFTSNRFLSPPSPRSIHNTGRGVRSFGRVDFRANSTNDVELVVMGDGVNFELPMDERDALLRPDFKNRQRTRSQTAIVSWDHVRSSELVVQTAAYERWSAVRQFPNAIDRYGALTDADRTLMTLGLKSDVTRHSGRHTVKGGIDLALLRPREELNYLSQPWIDFTHLPSVNESHVHFRGPNLGAGLPRPVVFSGRETGGQASLFLQDKVQLTSGLTLDLGVRVDRYSLVLAESHVSPRVNAAYRFPAGTVVFGSYNRFFVPPPIENVLAGSAGLTRLVSEIGRPLPPVRSIKENQFEAGVSQPVADIANVSVTSYYRLSDDPAHTSLFPDSRFYTYASFDKGRAYGLEVKTEVPRIADVGVSAYLNYAVGRVWFYNPITAGLTTEAGHLTGGGRFLAPMDQTHTVTSGLTYQHARTRLWGSLALEYGSGTPGGHGSDDHEHAGGDAHEHASGAELCGLRCPSHFTQSLSLGWNAVADGDQPRLTLQFAVENVSNRIYLLSRESTMVQGQYSIPRLFSASLRARF